MEEGEEKTREGDRKVTADHKLAYYVLLYHEGCTLIPSTWVNIDRRTYVWPTKPILSRPKMHQLKPNDTWASFKYRKHLGPYDTFQEALKVEEICAINISSTEDSGAIENTVNNFVQNKKRVIKSTMAYSPTDDKPPRKYIARKSTKVSPGKRSQDTDSMPPTKYVVETDKHDKTRTLKLFDEMDSDSSNEQNSSAIKNAESSVATSKAGTSSQNEGRDLPRLYDGDDTYVTGLKLVPVFQKNGFACYLQDSDSLLCMNEATGKWYAVPNVPDAREALSIEHQLRNPETGVIEKRFDSQCSEIPVISIPVSPHASKIPGKISATKATDENVETDVLENDRVSPSLLVKCLSRRKKKLR